MLSNVTKTPQSSKSLCIKHSGTTVHCIPSITDTKIYFDIPMTIFSEAYIDYVFEMKQKDFCPEVALNASIISAANVKFSINSATGALQVVEALNFEHYSGYDVVIETVDQHGTSAATIIYVEVVDVNEAPQMFAFADYHVAENSRFYTPINSIKLDANRCGVYQETYIAVNDPDAGQSMTVVVDNTVPSNLELQVKEYDCSMHNEFRFSLWTHRPLNYESFIDIEIKLTVEDEHGTKVQCNIHVYVDDCNDRPEMATQNIDAKEDVCMAMLLVS